MRLPNHDLHTRINGNLHVEFAQQELSSFSGLELFRRYFASISLKARVQRAFRRIRFRGDYGVLDYVLTLTALWLTGGRRLRHVGYLADDPLVKRLCGLATLPSDRSISRWLKQFSSRSLKALARLNSEIVTGALRSLDLPRVTLDFDGTVLTTGHKVGWAFRGYNPHKRYAPSYFPLLCHIAQTGHFLAAKNRPGNVHDSEGSIAVIRDSIAQVRAHLPGAKVEARLDAAFFQGDILKWLDGNGVEYVVKAPMYQWLGVKQTIQASTRWQEHTSAISSIKHRCFVKAWDRWVEFTVIRHKVSDKVGGKKFVQLDFFTPDDGIYEYTLLQTNKELRGDHLWEFYNGRCAMEHQIAEIKGEFGFDAIPTQHYQGNSAHQLISTLAYNLVRNFQIDTGLAKTRSKTQGRTGLFSFESLRTLRFEWIATAGRVLNVNGYKILRLCQNERRETDWQTISGRLDQIRAA